MAEMSMSEACMCSRDFISAAAVIAAWAIIFCVSVIGIHFLALSREFKLMSDINGN
jgi:hypothetical protein